MGPQHKSLTVEHHIHADRRDKDEAGPSRRQHECLKNVSEVGQHIARSL